MPSLSPKEIKYISKKISLVLRHRPEYFGLTLDGNGWCEVSALLRGFKDKNIYIDEAILNEVVEKNDKKRFSFNDDKTKIRANQGHSVKVDLQYKPVKPPDRLYHGTAEKFILNIKKQGLLKRKRHHVHLSKDMETAEKVGRRHGEPVILIIKSKEMWDLGTPFYLSENGVWLVEKVERQFIIFALGETNL